MLNILKKLKKIVTWFLKTWPRRILASFLVMLFIVAPVWFLFLRTPQASAEWFDEAWGYRYPITLSNSTGADLSDFQVAVTVDTASLITDGKMQSSCQDMRFTDNNGKLLNYWIEENNPGCNDVATKVWLKVPTVFDGTDATMVYFYYGNALATDAQDGDQVFEFFDDFNDDSIDNSKWQDTTGTNTIQESLGGKSGVLQSSGDANDIRFFSNYSTDASYIMESQYATTGDGGLFFDAQDANNGHLVAIRDEDSDGTTQINWYKRASAIWTSLALASSNPTINDSTFYQYKVVKNGTDFSVYQNDTKYLDSSDSTYVSGGGVGIRGTSTSYVDYILVRQYASSDPTSSNGTEEKGPGPVASWNFDEGYGTTTHDGTVNGNDGTISGATWQSEENCISGKCLYFDGADDYVATPYGNGIDPSSEEHTYSLWVRSTDISSSRMYFVQGNWSTNSRAYFGHTGGNWSMGIQGSGWGETSGGAVDTNWHFISIVFDGANAKFYLDGNYIYQKSYTSYSFNQSLSIGAALPYDSSYDFKGFIDEMKVYNYVRSSDQIYQDYQSGLSGQGGSGAGVSMGGGSQKWMSDGLVGHWKMDESSWNGTSGEVVDSSGNGNNGTSAGGVTTAAGKFGYGGDFNGTDDYVLVANSSSLQKTLNGFSASLWFNDDSFPVGNEVLMEQWYPDSGWAIGESSTSGKLYANLITSGGSNTNWISNATLSSGNWHNVVLVYDGTTEYMYIDGELDNSYSISGTLSTGYDNPIYIGANAVNAFTSSSIDEARIYSRALSPDEVRHLYEWAPGPVGHWKMDEKTGTTAYDTSGNGNNGTLTSMDASSDWVSGKVGAALDFDGSNDFIDAGNDSSLNFGTGSFTVNFWAKPRSLATRNGIVSRRQSSDSAYWQIVTYNGDDIEFYVDDGPTIKYGRVPASTDEWIFVSAVIDRDSNLLKISKNGGAPVTSDITGLGVIETPSTILRIGYEHANGDYFNGLIDDIRIYNYARTQKQILEDMDGRGGKTKPEIYLKFDEGYGTTAHNLGTASVNASLCSGTSVPVWTNNGKFDKALDFDGSNDMATLTDSSLFKYTGQDITFSFWMYIDSAETGAYVISKPWSGNGEYNYYFVTNGSNLTFHLDGTGSAQDFSSNYTFQKEQWYHIGLTINSETKERKFYVDGEETNASAHTISAWVPDYGDTVNTLAIGTLYPYGCGWAGNTGHAFDGKLDEIKIYKAVLTEDEIEKEYNQGLAMQLGSSGTESDGATSSQSASRAYCVPGDTATCSPPVGEWKMDEKTGTTAYDTSGNGNNGTLTNMDASTDWVSGKVGAALDFDGSNDSVNVVASDSLNMTTATIEGWFYPTAKSGGIAMSTGSGWLDERLVMQFGYPANNKIKLTVSNGTNYKYISSNSDLPLNEWSYIVATVDGTNIKIYLNGKLDKTDTQSYVPNLSGVPLYIGMTQGLAPNNFAGKIDQVRIYDYARTPAQIAWDYDRGKPMGWWKMDESEGTTAHDSSESRYDLTLSNIDGTADRVDGKYNNGISFSGSDSRLFCDSCSELSQQGSLSISAWVKVGSLSNSRYTITIRGSTYNIVPWAWFYYSGSNNKLSLWNYNGNSDSWSDTISIEDNAWHQVAVSAKNGEYPQFFVDGVNVTPSSGNSTYSETTSTTTSYPFEIGARTHTTSGVIEDFVGSMDDVRVYNYALTGEQIKQVYNNGAIRFGN